MPTVSRRRAVLAGLAAMSAAPWIGARAQGLFTKPLTLVVPYPPGGTADAFGRSVAQGLGAGLGATVVVENRGGANGNIGSAYVARQAPADGHTLLLGSTSTLAINPAIYRDMGYDPRAELAPLTLTHQMPNVLIVNKDTPYRSVDDVVAAARAEPGRVSYASAGNGNTMHMAGVLFCKQAGISLLHVPYRGGPPAMNDLLGGQVPMMFNNLPAVVPLAREGRVRALGVADKKRTPLLPDVPTMAEAGVPGCVSVVWNGLLVRRGAPQEAVDALVRALHQVLADEAFRQPLQAVGFEILSSSPAEFEALLDTDTRAMAQLARTADIHID